MGMEESVQVGQIVQASLMGGRLNAWQMKGTDLAKAQHDQALLAKHLKSLNEDEVALIKDLETRASRLVRAAVKIIVEPERQAVLQEELRSSPIGSRVGSKDFLTVVLYDQKAAGEIYDPLQAALQVSIEVFVHPGREIICHMHHQRRCNCCGGLTLSLCLSLAWRCHGRDESAPARTVRGRSLRWPRSGQPADRSGRSPSLDRSRKGRLSRLSHGTEVEGPDQIASGYMYQDKTWSSSLVCSCVGVDLFMRSVYGWQCRHHAVPRRS